MIGPAIHFNLFSSGSAAKFLGFPFQRFVHRCKSLLGCTIERTAKQGHQEARKCLALAKDDLGVRFWL